MKLTTFNYKSANDEVWTCSRTAPLRDTLVPVPGYPRKLVLFKMLASRFWQVRCWVNGRSVRRSTGTTSLPAAQQFARHLYEDLLMAERSDGRARLALRGGRPSPAQAPSITVAQLAERLLEDEQARVRRGELSVGSWQVLHNRLHATVLPRWAGESPRALNAARLAEFAQDLSRRFTTTTLHQYLVIVRKLLGLAVRLEELETLPVFPKVKVVGGVRGAFTPSEYWAVMRTARRLRGVHHPESPEHLRVHHRLRTDDCRMPPDLAWAMGFMVNSFIRPSDLKHLKHRHVEIVQHGRHCYLRLTLPASKRHAAPIVTMAPAVRIYRELLKRQQVQGLGNPDDHLFLPHLRDREHVLKVLGVHMNWVLKETSLKLNAHGQPRSLYSLRHSAITFRLLYGSHIDLLTLARNARTSVEMIQRHYASTLVAEQNIAMLQSRRAPTAPRR